MQEFHFFHNKSFIDLYPIQFGKENCAPNHSFGPALTHNYLIHYILGGKGTFFHTDLQTTHHLTTGQGFLMAPDQMCSYTADAEDPWTYCWIEFNGSKAKHFMTEAGFNKNNYVYNSKRNGLEATIMQPLLDIVHNPTQHDAFILGHFYHFIDNLIKFSRHHTPQPINAVQNFYIREAINYIGQKFTSGITVEELAEHCNLNRNYFSRLFKAELDMTPNQLITQYRMNLARELLETSQDSIKVIAEKTGYSNQFNFSATFKKHQDMSPLEWRKRYSRFNLN